MRQKRHLFKSLVIVLALVVSMMGFGVQSDAAAKVALNKKTATAFVGKTISLKLTGTKKSPKWSSSNKKVATVDKKGKVKGIKAGKATITAKLGKKKYTCKVTVEKIPATKIKLNKTKATLNVGDTLQLKGTVTPKKTSNKTITWSSSNKSVAAVSKKGVVTAKAAGTATITGVTSSGKKATCKITVVGEATPSPSPSTIAVSSVTLNASSKTIIKGESATLTATVAPANATNPGVTWTSSNPAVATVANGVVNAVSAGDTTITATAADGSGKSASCSIKVTENWYDILGVSANKGEIVDYMIIPMYDDEDGSIYSLFLYTVGTYQDHYNHNYELSFVAADGVSFTKNSTGTYQGNYSMTYKDKSIGVKVTNVDIQDLLMSYFDIKYDGNTIMNSPSWNENGENGDPNITEDGIVLEIGNFNLRLGADSISGKPSVSIDPDTVWKDKLKIEDVTATGFKVSFNGGKKVNAKFDFIGDPSTKYAISQIDVDSENDVDKYIDYGISIWGCNAKALIGSFDFPSDGSEISITMDDRSLKVEYDETNSSLDEGDYAFTVKDDEQNEVYSIWLRLYPDVNKILKFDEIALKDDKEGSTPYTSKSVPSYDSSNNVVPSYDDKWGYYMGYKTVTQNIDDVIENLSIVLESSISSAGYTADVDKNEQIVLIKKGSMNVAYFNLNYDPN